MTVAEAAPTRSIRCPQCALALEPAGFAGGALVECPACRSQLAAVFFPAYENPPAPVSTAAGERALDGEAACFFHPEKRAVLACAGCGRFLCALCDLPLGPRHLCPTCLGSGKPPELVLQRTCWSHVALLFGVLPLLAGLVVWVLFIFTGCAAIFCALWGWKKPGGLAHGPRHWAAVVGLLGGLTQLAIVGGAGFAIWWRINRNG